MPVRDEVVISRARRGARDDLVLGKLAGEVGVIVLGAQVNLFADEFEFVVTAARLNQSRFNEHSGAALHTASRARAGLALAMTSRTIQEWVAISRS